MIGILVIAHENLGESLASCAAHVMGGKPPQLSQINITIQDDPKSTVDRARALIDKLNSGDGVLVLSDIYGATPCNIASQLIIPGQVECLSGVNLPMLVRALTYREQVLSVVVEKALSGGKDGVIHVQLES